MKYRWYNMYPYHIDICLKHNNTIRHDEGQYDCDLKIHAIQG